MARTRGGKTKVESNRNKDVSKLTFRNNEKGKVLKVPNCKSRSHGSHLFAAVSVSETKSSASTSSSSEIQNQQNFTGGVTDTNNIPTASEHDPSINNQLQSDHEQNVSMELSENGNTRSQELQDQQDNEVVRTEKYPHFDYLTSTLGRTLSSHYEYMGHAIISEEKGVKNRYGSAVLKCFHCCRPIIGSNGNALYNFTRHLQRVHPDQKIDSKKSGKKETEMVPSSEEICTQIAPKTVVNFFGNKRRSSTNGGWIQKKYRKAVLDYIALRGHPLSETETPGFRYFMSELNPDINPLSRRTLGRDLEKAVSHEVEPALKNELALQPNYSIHIILDIWSSISREGIIGIKVQFINDRWQLISKTISFKYFGERHTGDNIREKVIESLKSIKIDPMQVGKVMADNASNITKAFKNTVLQSVTPEWTPLSRVYDTSEENFPFEEMGLMNDDSDDDSDDTFLEGVSENEISQILLQWDRISCVAHTIQLVVHDAEKGDLEAAKTIQQCKDIINFFRNSNYYYGLLKKAANKTLSGYNKTRWDSTLTSINDIYEIFSDVQQLLLRASNDQKLQKKDKIEVPKNNFKAAIGEIIALLKPIHEVTKMVQSATKSTSAIVQSLIVYTYGKINEVQCSRYFEMKKLLLNGIKTRFEARLCKDESFTAATILNPAIKLGLFENALAKNLGLPTIEEAREALINQLNYYVPDDENLNVDSGETELDRNDCHEGNDDKVEDKDGFKCFLETISQKTRLNTCQSKVSEIEAYLKEAFSDTQNLENPIIYWKNKEDLFPRLSKLARILLAIPASSGDVERLFSVAGCIKNTKRNRLKPDVVEQLILYRESRMAHVMSKLDVLEKRQTPLQPA